jgi:hypothetical protein
MRLADIFAHIKALSHFFIKKTSIKDIPTLFSGKITLFSQKKRGCRTK